MYGGTKGDYNEIRSENVSAINRNKLDYIWYFRSTSSTGRTIVWATGRIRYAKYDQWHHEYSDRRGNLLSEFPTEQEGCIKRYPVICL